MTDIASAFPILPATAMKIDRRAPAWVAVLAASALVMALKPEFAWLQAFPKSWVLPITAWLDLVMDPVVAALRGISRWLSWTIAIPLTGLKDILQGMPWSATLMLFALIAHRAAGRRIAVFTAAALFYIVLVGYWDEAMSTLALVGLAIPMAVVIGFLVGAVAQRYPRANAIVQSTLDFMQTVPAFAYLIPILLIFGFGPVVGLIASIIYAAPPMVRNTILGLERVPLELTESGRMSGCTAFQEFWWIRVPSAMPQLIIGLNQTTMAAFSMVIIAAIIGGFQDIGWEVLSTMRKAQFGQSLIAGLAMALLAMVLDRITCGLTGRGWENRSASNRPRAVLVAVLVLFAIFVLATTVDALWRWPETWIVYPAEPLNAAVNGMTTHYGAAMEALKRHVLFYFLLPLKIGLVRTITPMSWGFAFTFTGMAVYWVALIALGTGAWLLIGWRTAVALLLVGAFLFHGATGVPWPAFIAVITLLAFSAGGLRTAAFAFLAQAFLLLSGFWQAAMLSVYLCAAAVTICILLGSLIGIAAAHSDGFSKMLRPVNDALQTIPQFVLLIPLLMLFRVGDFTALLAVVLYAIVPMIRYTEAGLRNVSPTLNEAGKAMGCTAHQLFWQVKLPQALPEILLGINQTIMFSLAMLVIAALVGTSDLGQEVYIALGKADAGRGLAAGIGMALIAMTADRILQQAASRRRAALGLS
jgi:glycine betaine/proline transport system permease protein